jgi:hypothetical protein
VTQRTAAGTRARLARWAGERGEPRLANNQKRRNRLAQRGAAADRERLGDEVIRDFARTAGENTGCRRTEAGDASSHTRATTFRHLPAGTSFLIALRVRSGSAAILAGPAGDFPAAFARRAYVLARAGRSRFRVVAGRAGGRTAFAAKLPPAVKFWPALSQRRLQPASVCCR